MCKTPGESNIVFFIWWRYLCYGVKMIKVVKKIQPGSSKSVEPANSSSFISFCLMLGVTFFSFWGGCRHQWENSIKPTGKLRKIFFPTKVKWTYFTFVSTSSSLLSSTSISLSELDSGPSIKYLQKRGGLIKHQQTSCHAVRLPLSFRETFMFKTLFTKLLFTTTTALLAHGL